ncbi:MAG: hypothetical protein OEU53_02305, partial [Gammaproteobacteria bacterium]|nr:hypothetical protein [Gammaproteobacteria bacterium]
EKTGRSTTKELRNGNHKDKPIVLAESSICLEYDKSMKIKRHLSDWSHIFAPQPEQECGIQHSN